MKTIMDRKSIDSVLYWFTNSYECCQDIQIDLLEITDKTCFTEEDSQQILKIMESWLDNEDNVRLDFEKSIEFDIEEILFFINQRSKTFQLKLY